MKYGYTVKKDGVLYPAGTEVLDKDVKEPKKGFLDAEELKTYTPDDLKALATKLGVEFTDETTHEELAELCSKVEVEIPDGGSAKVAQYKKSDIARMKVEDLKKLAVELEIAGVDEATGEKLKEEIIDKLGL